MKELDELKEKCVQAMKNLTKIVNMKKIISLALASLMMVGCDNDGKPIGYNYLVLDSCEYMVGFNQLAHKGNCSFCKERDSIKWEKRKKELEKFVIKLNEK